MTAIDLTNDTFSDPTISRAALPTGPPAQGATTTASSAVETANASVGAACPECIRGEAIEQVMRLTGDDLLVLPFLTAAAGSSAAAAALGRLLAAAPVKLVDRCPLVAFTTGRRVDPRWRDWYPAREESLWSMLMFYQDLYATPGIPDDPRVLLSTPPAAGSIAQPITGTSGDDGDASDAGSSPGAAIAVHLTATGSLPDHVNASGLPHCDQLDPLALLDSWRERAAEDLPDMPELGLPFLQ